MCGEEEYGGSGGDGDGNGVYVPLFRGILSEVVILLLVILLDPGFLLLFFSLPVFTVYIYGWSYGKKISITSSFHHLPYISYI